MNSHQDIFVCIWPFKQNKPQKRTSSSLVKAKVTASWINQELRSLLKNIVVNPFFTSLIAFSH